MQAFLPIGPQEISVRHPAHLRTPSAIKINRCGAPANSRSAQIYHSMKQFQSDTHGNTTSPPSLLPPPHTPPHNNHDRPPPPRLPPTLPSSSSCEERRTEAFLCQGNLRAYNLPEKWRLFLAPTRDSPPTAIAKKRESSRRNAVERQEVRVCEERGALCVVCDVMYVVCVVV